MYNTTDILPPLTLYYNFVKEINTGGNAVVWSIIDNNGKSFACKIPKIGRENIMYFEAAIMGKVAKYPNNSPFLTFYGIYSYKDQPVIVMELFDGYQLSNLKIKLTEQQLLYMAKQLYSQLAYLNNVGTCHGDVSFNNILYNNTRILFIDIGGQNYNIHTEDFKFAETTIEYWNKAINLGYDSNELLWKGDVFNLGKIFRRLITGVSISEYDYMQNPNLYKLNTGYSTMDIIVNSSMEVDISIRPSAKQIVEYIDNSNL